MAAMQSEDAFKLVCEAIRNGEAVLWAGAGLSAYAGYPTGRSFARMLADELGESQSEELLILLDVADRYEVKKGRDTLQARIGEVFGREPSSIETHRSLSLIKRIPCIVTTNYDRLFERAYGDDIITIASEQELPKTRGQGWGNRKTILYKPHGDVDHLDEIIITSKDYNRFEKDRESLIWTRIATLPAEYSMIFIGYSLDDQNTRDVLGKIFKRLGPRETPYFIITQKANDDSREWYKNHGVLLIEKDAVEAINEILDYVVDTSYIDCQDDPVRIALSMPLFKERNVNFCINVENGIVHELTVEAENDHLPLTIKGSIHFSEIMEVPERKMLEDVVQGRSFETVELCTPTSKARLSAEANGILLIDPDTTYFSSITITPHPREEKDVDLLARRDRIRVPRVRVKRYLSETNMRAVLTTSCFELVLDLSLPDRSGTLKMKVSTFADIEDGYRTYALLNAWVEGETIQVIPLDGGESWAIPSEFIQKVPEASDLIRSRYRYFRDLSEILGAIPVALVIPKEGIRANDLQNIADAAKLIREGRKGGILTLPLRVDEVDMAKMLGDEPMFIRLTSPEMVETFEIFGQRVPIPYALEGHRVVPANLAEARAELERGAETVTVIYDGSVGELYQRYLPNPPQRGDQEMTPP